MNRHRPMEAAHIGEMARYFRSQLASGEHRGMLVLFNSQRAMDLFHPWTDLLSATSAGAEGSAHLPAG